MGISFIYCALFVLSASGSWASVDAANLPGSLAFALAVVAIGLPIVVLIWGAVIASRQIRQGAGCPSTPEGLILTLLATCVGAGLFSLPFAAEAEYFVVISLPLAVWVYLALLQRRPTSPLEAVKQDSPVRSA